MSITAKLFFLHKQILTNVGFPVPNPSLALLLSYLKHRDVS